MSAEDTATAAAEVAPNDATAPVAIENGAATAATATNGDATTDPKKGGNKRNNRKDFNKDDDKPEVPIEELFDLTKPIPRVSCRCLSFWLRNTGMDTDTLSLSL